MPQIDVTMQGVGRQFAKMASEIEALLIEKQMMLEKIAELTKAPKKKTTPTKVNKKKR